MRRDDVSPTRELLEWVARCVHARARAVAVVSLPGGMTAAMDRITVESPSGLIDVVLRRWADEEWTKGLAAREAAALGAVRGWPVPAPRLLGMDEDGGETGVRCTLTSAIPGQPDLAPHDLPSWLSQLATTQATIHAVPVHTAMRWPKGRGEGGTSSMPDRYGEHDRSLEWIPDSGLREAARQAAAGAQTWNTAFVHGDYQHFNVLWRDGQLTGVVDWPHAGIGTRGSDVGHCRLNLAVLFDAATARDYLVTYERAAGIRIDRTADLRALLCFDLEWQQFIPVQVAGRAPLDVPGMPTRVTAAIRDALTALD